MSQPTITCPQCNTEIKLTESLAAPLIESTRKGFEEKLAQQESQIANREMTIKNKEIQLKQEQNSLREQVEKEVEEHRKKDRVTIAAEEAKKAKVIFETELDDQTKKVSFLQAELNVRGEKLAEAKKEQEQFLKKQRELDDEKKEMGVTIEKRIQEGLEGVRQKARKDAEDSLKLKVAEKEQTITSMQKQIEDLMRKAEQGSQQLQGEVQELELESMLRTKFPNDIIEPVPKGEYGGDVLQRVCGLGGQLSGTILWESKRTKNWSDGWLTKLREDQRTAKAEVAVIISQALPAHIETFELFDGVWVAHPRVAFPIAMMLRHALLELSIARKSSDGQQTKMEIVYQYLTGPKFRLRVGAIVEAFTSMQEDLDKEKKVIMKQWYKRNAQIEQVMSATIGMYGDLQAIAGKSLLEIEGLELKALDFEVDVEEI